MPDEIKTEEEEEIVEEEIENPEDEEIIEEDNPLELSDEDFLKLNAPEEVVVEEEEKEVTKPVDKPPEEKSVDKPEKEIVEEVPEKKPEEQPKEKETDPETKPKEKPAEEPEAVIDYEAEYKKLTAPFKANGRDIQVQNSDDAIRLMQMGVNYSKKMAGLKPALRTVKILEKNGLMDPEELGFLIDLKNKKPEAITKLIKDSGIKPLDIDTEAESTYKPNTPEVSDTELNLDSVIDDIKDTPTFNKTLNIITKEWDEDSRKVTANQPHIISIINEHVADGTYEKVTQAVNYERSLGRMTGISDLEAYKQMGDKLYPAQDVSTKSKTEPVVPATSKETKKEEARKKNKKAASPVRKKSGTPAAPSSFNPLDLSDEEFEKLGEKAFIKPNQ